MAPLAQVRHLCLEKGAAGRAVRCVAGKAVFDDRGVIPEKGPPQISMAFKAVLVDVLGIYQFVRNSPMGIVAIGTLGFSLPYRMVGLPHKLSPDADVAAGTYFCFIGCRSEFGDAIVDGVTIRA